ncbi:BQ2448_1721 [Microbotryum intermedium]|uniref:BQ2448_1721 protein n=1 Tax=Microbotryum intermedium TaxID=269621 RepID=A0A238FAY4_9BASI|nr:BQ2448_1721 [Microbotryum intermedium]
MDGQDRRASLQLGRQARKEAASPYARPKASPASANASASASASTSGTPSRLSGLLSYLSPFRRGKKKEPSPEPEPESDDEQDNDDGDEPQHSDGSNHDAQHVNAPALELHGEFIEDHDMDANAPPSPTSYQNIYPNLGSSITASKSMPHLVSAMASSATPRPHGGFTSTWPRSATRGDLTPVSASAASWGQAESMFGSERSPPGRANEELARFFREKADRGDEPLTAIEQAGVLHLMQQAKAENLPTAFTPNFRSASPAHSVQPFYARQDSVVPISPSAASNNSMFGDVGASPSTSMSESTAGHTPYRRRRPIYVGAGYSSRSARRNRTPGSHSASTGSNLTRGQSEGGLLNSLGGTNSTAEGKRRRVEAEDVPPVASTSNLSYSASPGPSASPSPAPSSTDNTKPSIFSRAKVTANAVSTPVRPSPLWQVSKADTPSPSPPKKAASAAPRSTTRAADMMMHIIRQEDAAKPDKASPMTSGREAFINPYERTDHNPLARIPRSRPVRPLTPSRPTSARVAAQEAASTASSPKKVSPLEQLERSMPAKYRRDDGNRSKTASSVASASPAPTPQKRATQPTQAPTFAPPTKPAAVTKPTKKASAPTNPFSALASETDEAEDDEEDEDGLHEEDEEDEEEDEEDDNEEEESDNDDVVIIEEVVKNPAPKIKNVLTPQAPAPAPSVPALSVPASKPVEKPPPVAPMFGAPSSNMFGKASSAPSKQPPTVEPAPIPKPAFSFFFGATPSAPVDTPKAAPPKSVVPNGSSTTSDAEARKQALEAARSSLPTFVFAGTWNACTGRGEAAEATTRAAQDLAKMMSQGELPMFEF